jgi:TIR domain/Pentapeptide repeats (8 copies)
MANPEHLAKLNEGVETWNEWRKSNHEMVPDLSGAELVWIALKGVELSRTNLRRANLAGAEFRGANFSAADLSWANLRDADLQDTNFSGANLIGSDLSGANLKGAYLAESNLNRANLSHADLGYASIGWTVFGNNDLREAKGLTTVRHEGASLIGIDTIYSSQGKIPMSFLRGAGVPELFIEYMPSLVASAAVQFYSCFISYSTKDQGFADRLYADLQNKGVRCWFAPHDIQGGKKLHEQIDAAIRMHERLLLILSPNSMSSKWVKTEIRNARKREVAEKRRVLFPVRLASYEALRDWALFDADEGEDLATEIREYYIPDFTEWKSHDSYQKEFEKLLRDLRMEGG